MSEGKRPGGLTALAVFNFLAVACDGIQMLRFGLPFAMGSSEAFREAASRGNENNEQFQKALALFQEHAGFFGFVTLAHGALAFVLLLAGIGYLMQKRFLGRTLGNVYAIMSLSSFVYILATVPVLSGIENVADAPVIDDMELIISAIYPLMTLILLNTTFKEDFIR